MVESNTQSEGFTLGMFVVMAAVVTFLVSLPWTGLKRALEESRMS